MPDETDQLRESLGSVLALARIKFGNLDADANKVFKRAEQLLASKGGRVSGTEATPDGMLMTISLLEWLNAKKNYMTLRIALCDIEGGVADTRQEAQDIAARAVSSTPPTL